MYLIAFRGLRQSVCSTCRATFCATRGYATGISEATETASSVPRLRDRRQDAPLREWYSDPKRMRKPSDGTRLMEQRNPKKQKVPRPAVFESARVTAQKEESYTSEQRNLLKKFRQEITHNGVFDVAWQIYPDVRDRGLMSMHDFYLFTAKLLQVIRRTQNNVEDEVMDQGIAKHITDQGLKYEPIINTLVGDIKAGSVKISPPAMVRVLASMRERSMVNEAMALWDWTRKNLPGLLRDGYVYAVVIDILTIYPNWVSPEQMDSFLEKQTENMQTCESLYAEYKEYRSRYVPAVDAAMIHAFCFFGSITRAIELFYSMEAELKKDDTIPAEDKAHNLTRAYRSFIMNPQDPQLGAQFLRDALQNGVDVRPSAVSRFLKNLYNVQVDMDALFALISQYMKTIDASKEKGYLLFPIDYCMLFFSRNPVPTPEAMQKLNEFVQLVYLNAENRIHTSVFNTILARLSSDWKKSEIVLQVLDGMKSVGFKPNTVTYRILIHAFEDDCKLVRKYWLEQLEYQKNFPKDIGVWSENFRRLMATAGVSGDWNFVFEQALEIREYLDEETLKAVMRVYDLRARQEQ